MYSVKEVERVVWIWLVQDWLTAGGFVTGNKVTVSIIWGKFLDKLWNFQLFPMECGAVGQPCFWVCCAVLQGNLNLEVLSLNAVYVVLFQKEKNALTPYRSICHEVLIWSSEPRKLIMYRLHSHHWTRPRIIWNHSMCHFMLTKVESGYNGIGLSYTTSIASDILWYQLIPRC
jgi:hypothetical protein